MQCYKCKKEMTTTPICCHCGIIPIIEHSSECKKKEMELLRTLQEEIIKLNAVIERHEKSISRIQSRIY